MMIIKYLLGRAAIKGVGIKKCDHHDLQVDIQGRDERLIYDHDFRWLFYDPVNGPEA